jgi:RNA polymerase sigma-70 factor (ECF subfamily)
MPDSARSKRVDGALRWGNRALSTSIGVAEFPVVTDLENDLDGCERLRELYTEHGPYLRAQMTRMLHDPQQAEDVVQETLFRAWRHLGRMTDERGSIRGWLLRVAHNIAVDWIRARRARPLEVDAALRPEYTARVEDPSEELVLQLDAIRLLRGLTPEQSFIIYEIYVSGLTAADLAKLLGIPVGTVKSRAFYGLRTLRARMDRSAASR